MNDCSSTYGHLCQIYRYVTLPIIGNVFLTSCVAISGTSLAGSPESWLTSTPAVFIETVPAMSCAVIVSPPAKPIMRSFDNKLSATAAYRLKQSRFARNTSKKGALDSTVLYRTVSWGNISRCCT
jgi:hypothetical protein